MLSKFLVYPLHYLLSFSVCVVLISLPAYAQVVPSELDLGGVRLAIPALIRPIIQAKIVALKGDQATYLKKLNQADLYLPIIAEVFKENGIPDEFKYIALFDQKNPDDKAFWQLPKSLINKFGLTNTDGIDESTNIVAIAQVVGKHLKGNQATLKNWLLTLVSYHETLSKTQSYFANNLPQNHLQNFILNKKLDLATAMHPDLVTFVANWAMFKDVLGHNPYAPTMLVRYKDASNKTLEDIAKSFQLKVSDIVQHNDWLAADLPIPAGKGYEVLLPISTGSPSAEVEIQTLRGGEIDFNTYEEDTYTETAEEALEETTKKTHTVAKGETLYSISRKYGISIDALKQLNLMGVNYTLFVGQEIKVEGNSPVIKPIAKTQIVETKKTNINKTHTIQAGETLSKIARTYNVTIADIRAWNALASDNIKVGQKIVIKTIAAPNIGGATVKPKDKPKDKPKEDITAGNLVYAQRTLAIKTVPAEMLALGLRLRLSTEAKQKIQLYVNKLTENVPAYFRQMEHIDSYMPLIERELQQAGLPLDFRFLPIQESALKANAVSKSNAVGYWQFKKESAVEEGVIVNEVIDERMNIVASTMGAINYLKKSNLMFDNWVNALLSYNMGRTGAKNQLEKTCKNQTLQGVEVMQIDKDTHWYILKFLAHLVAFDEEVGVSTPAKVLTDYTQGSKKTLFQIAQEQKTTVQAIQPHNQWLKSNMVPVGKAFSVIVPKK